MSVVKKVQNTRRPWAVRWYEDGSKRERSFQTKGEAVAFDTDRRHGLRYGSDDAAAGKRNFGEACEGYLARLVCSPRSREVYDSILRNHIGPGMGARTVAQVADNRDGFADFLAELAGKVGSTRVGQARTLVIRTLDEEIASGRLGKHRLASIKTPDGLDSGEDESFDPAKFPTLDQIGQIADVIGVQAWLMVSCGLRIQEAIAVEKRDFILSAAGARLLRVSRQASRDGSEAVPLKHRKRGESRIVPVPDHVWDLVRDMDDGILTRGHGVRRYAVQSNRPYPRYDTVLDQFCRARDWAGVDASITPHKLRHMYASMLLRDGIPLTDVAGFMGHANINTAYKIYRSELPDAAGDAIGKLNARYEKAFGVGV